MAQRRRLVSTPTSLSPASAAGLALAVLVVFFLFLLADARQQASNGAMKRADAVVRLVGRDYERLIDEARTALVEVSERAEVRTVDANVCDTLARRLSRVRGYVDVALSQTTGDVVCSARQDRADGVRLRTVPLLRGPAVVDARFGRYAIDPVTRRGVATILAPAADESGTIRGVLGVSVDLSALDLDIHDAGLPDGASVVVADGAGLVLAHSPAPNSGLGEFLAESVVKRLGARKTGTLDAVDAAGVPAQLVFAPLARDVVRFGDASVIVALPDSSLLGQAAGSAARVFGGLLLAILLLAGLAWLVIDSFVARPAALLAQAMRRLVDADGSAEQVPPRLVVDDAPGPLRDALNAYETVASRVIEREACVKLSRTAPVETDTAPPPAPPADGRDAAAARPALVRRDVPTPRPPMRHKAAAAARRDPVEAHWGLAEPAFENAPNPRFLYLAPGHEAVLRGLTYAVRQRRGCGVLVGKPGCGKTTLIRSLIQRLEPDRYDVAFLLRPLHDSIELLREVLYELGVHTEEKRRSELLHALGARFVSNFGRHRETVIIVDEAHLAPARTLKELGLLLNYQSNERSLVTLVLSGSPELDERLMTSGHLDGRLGVRCRIAPLDAEHTGKYVTHRLTVAGGAATIFTADALRLIHEMTDGIPRAINDVCDNVLLLGSRNDVSQVDGDTLRAMLNGSGRSTDRAVAFDLPATWLARDGDRSEVR